MPPGLLTDIMEDDAEVVFVHAFVVDGLLQGAHETSPVAELHGNHRWILIPWLYTAESIAHRQWILIPWLYVAERTA